MLGGKLRLVWITPAQAIGELWEKPSDQRAFAKPWFALLRAEIAAAKSAIERTALHAVAQEGRQRHSGKNQLDMISHGDDN